MKALPCRIYYGAKRHLAWLPLLSATVAYAQSALPLPIGFYSSSDCKHPPNAALLHFDGKNLNGAHSAACRDRVSSLGPGAYRLEQSCPAEQRAEGSAAYVTSTSRQLSVQSATSFVLVDGSGVKHTERYRYCGTTIDGQGSF